LSTERLAPVEEIEAILSTSISVQSSSLPPKDCEPTIITSRKHKVKSTILNCKQIIEEMRQDRKEYYKARLRIEQELRSVWRTEGYWTVKVDQKSKI
jgi:hypothetical protein